MAGSTDWNSRLAHVLIEASPDALVAITEDTRILFWNQGAENIFGYSRHEAVGQSLFDLIVQPERAEEARRFLAETIETGAATAEAIRRLKDGTLVHVDVSSKVVRDEAGQV